ncbi:glucose-6-phosphate dehydrogenase [Pseudomonas sp. ZM23]|uniref:Glucose-6-phosphate 1-dehydrogenase n=1 Tax=Pseudomonas triclosanedens TaxID=2961893 RepID=A0ABY6ZZ13_9PSED|nr:glucose-6-phosphate dehydrogenase [Pseudomonas triclosanedens]MCP8462377.1 glucose-6-phosphate dehydrogenase [Pseudomonas triclosanedens]MCP8468015.1 glucose-6-phosphate dehydrogenase [Pseudomonas triclosanedens]MCP8474774.1 glucose-6-phosphate dehydrogenase [Pseudomonas triclosanedens]WAI49571.1 glucose-6-phosphate dehydrogenase [Pseudomonas triclosanedens]
MNTPASPSLPSSCDILVFGGSGDLALHKLLPALYHLHRENRLPADTRIFALARSNRDAAAYLALAERNCRAQVARNDFIVEAWRSFAQRLEYLAIDASQSADFGRLAKALKHSEGRVLVHYLATAPSLFAPIAQNLKIAGLAGPLARIVLEKPLGHSLESARAINQAIGEVFDESRVFRIDHYLGKETVQNLMALRFANTLFEPVWRNGHIDHVQITVSETLGVENRGGYYDHAGAMRDMVQNHLLQLLCLVAMEAPVRFDAEAVRNEKVKIIEALRPISGQDVQDKTVRGQYAAGHIGGQEVPAYWFEKNVDNDSDTETFVAIQAEIDNWRWSGVPFYLRTGKRMAKKCSEIVIQFKPAPNGLIGSASNTANRLWIRLQPEERISVQLMAKAPGKGMQLEPVELDLNLAQAFNRNKRRWDAYERLLLDVIEGDSTLFMRRDEVEAAWRWVDPIIKGWQEYYQSPRPYPAGSNGPEQAQTLLELQGRRWLE